MGFLIRQDFGQGWTPDADGARAPAGTVLRADNLVLDELGVLALRQGSAYLYANAFSDLDVHSLHTEVLNGVRQRLVGANDRVYVNDTSLLSGLDGSGDVAFGGHLGQILLARGSSRYKYDGTTVRNWGLVHAGAAPTVVPSTVDGKTLATGAQAEAPAFVRNAGLAIGFTTDHAGNANGALTIATDPTTGNVRVTKTFAAPTNFATYDAGTVASDDDRFTIYFAVDVVANLEAILVQVDVNDGTFATDYYEASFDSTQFNADGLFAKLSMRRGDMNHVSRTSGKDWSTVKAVRVLSKAQSASTITFDTIRLEGGAITGQYQWLYLLTRDTGTYVAKSPESALSALVQSNAQGAVVTIPADTTRDSQATAVWLFRIGESLDVPYRTAVYSPGGALGTGAINITDNTSDADALTLDITLEPNNLRPPVNIVDIEGPYFDRTMVLTSDGFLWPSRQLDPDAFSSDQAIRVAAADETAYWVKKAFGGIYIGTSKDIYRIDGDGVELPDGSVNFAKRPLNIDHPPIGDGLAQDGNLLVYLSDDGWRAFTGEATSSIVAATSLLYRGKTRHGVSPVNLTGGRFRAAIAKGQFLAVTPEGDATGSSDVIYRHAPLRGAWYRHVYAANFQVVYREPDGTVLAGDTAGRVWILDSGTDDAGTDIAVTFWTPASDDGDAYADRDLTDFHIDLDTGGAFARVDLVRDDGATSALALFPQTTGLQVQTFDARTVGTYRRLQLQLTGSFTTFRYASCALTFVARPISVKVFNSGPLDLGGREFAWIRHLWLKVKPSGPLTITVTVDGVAKAILSATPVAGVDAVVPIDVGRACVGRQVAITVASASTFIPYWVEVAFRESGKGTQKARMKIPLGGGA